MLRPWMQRRLLNHLCSSEEEVFKTTKSAVRVALEKSYKDIKQNWTNQNFAHMLKVRKDPIELLYHTSCLLFSIRICLYKGGQVQHQYQVRAPTVVEYLELSKGERFWSPLASGRLRQCIPRTCTALFDH